MKIAVILCLVLLAGCDTITNHFREKRLEKIGPPRTSPPML